MASYNGTVILSGMISPTDTTDKYPTHEDKLGKGGYMSVADIAERDNIPLLRRKQGMMVYVVSTNIIFQLINGIENINWVDFSTQITASQSSGSLELSTLTVNGVVNSIFGGLSIPNNEILYVIGDEFNIGSKVYNGILIDVLDLNKNHNFIIVFNGTSSSVYVNTNIPETQISDIINSYPRDYTSINLVTNPLSTKLKNILSSSYTTNLEIYALTGIMSKIEKETNLFSVLNTNEEFIAIFDGINYSAYMNKNVEISYLQSRLIIG